MTLTCPYCDKEFKEPEAHIDIEDCNDAYDSECPHCDKRFAYEVDVEVKLIPTSYKAACLNGGEHEWETQACYPEFASRRVCKCGLSEDVYTGKEIQAMADKYYQEIKRDL